MRFAVLVEVSLREGISDPQGSTIERALPALGFDDVTAMATGKAFRFEVEAVSPAAAGERAGELCRRFLTNPVIEDARVTVEDGHGAEASSAWCRGGAGPAGGGAL